MACRTIRLPGHLVHLLFENVGSVRDEWCEERFLPPAHQKLVPTLEQYDAFLELHLKLDAERSSEEHASPSENDGDPEYDLIPIWAKLRKTSGWTKRVKSESTRSEDSRRESLKVIDSPVILSQQKRKGPRFEQRSKRRDKRFKQQSVSEIFGILNSKEAVDRN